MTRREKKTTGTPKGSRRTLGHRRVAAAKDHTAHAEPAARGGQRAAEPGDEIPGRGRFEIPLDADGKILPTIPALMRVAAEFSDRSPAELWRLAQAATLIDAYQSFFESVVPASPQRTGPRAYKQ